MALQSPDPDPKKNMFAQLGMDYLGDPTNALQILAARRKAPAQTTQALAPKPKPQPAAEPLATAPTTTGQAAPSTAPAAAARPAATTSSRWNQARDAARLAYQTEMDNIKARIARGEQVDSLEYKRAQERYNNKLGEIDALERDRSKATVNRDMIARNRERRAAQNEMAGKALSGLQSRVPGILSEGQALADRNRELARSQEEIKPARDVYPREEMNQPPAPTAGGIGFMEALIRNLRQAVASSPQGQLSSVAAPAPASAPFSLSKSMNQGSMESLYNSLPAPVPAGPTDTQVENAYTGSVPSREFTDTQIENAYIGLVPSRQLTDTQMETMLPPPARTPAVDPRLQKNISTAREGGNSELSDILRGAVRDAILYELSR